MPNSTMYSPQYKEHNQGQDRISELPHDVIVSILSCMGLKDSARTSILSRRWRHEWTNLTNLNFDAFDDTSFKDCHLFDLKFAKDKFSKYVNRVVNMHCNDISIDKFRVSSPLDKYYTRQIDGWVEFAFSKRVKVLELDFLHATPNYYTLGRPSLIKHLTNKGDMRFLKTLHLSHVNVVGDVLEFMLSQCSLERFSISFSYGLERLRAKSSSLKYFKMQWCSGLKELELEAEELVCFECNDRSANIAFNHVPSLVEVYFTTFEPRGWPPYFSQFKSFSDQLIKLSLQLGEVDRRNIDLNFSGFDSLQLLELKVFADGYNNDTLEVCAHLVECSPSLVELKLMVTWERLELEWKYNDHELESINANIGSKGLHKWTPCTCLGEPNGDPDEEGGMNFEMKLEQWAREVKHRPKNTLLNLTSFEFVGFIGISVDVKLVRHIVEISPNLNRTRLISEPLYGQWCKHRQEAYKNHAYKLAVGFPCTINFEVL